MSKIEEKLSINEQSDSMLLMNALDNFYRESNMVFNNIYLSQTIFNNNKKNIFPLEYDLYDASWYKNLIISAEILIDRFHYELDESKDYSYLFDNVNSFDFLAFAKKWNTINYVVKFNLDDNMWKVKSSEWKVSQTTTWLNELLSMKVVFDKNKMDNVLLDCNIYEPLVDAIGRNGFNEVINYIVNSNSSSNNDKDKKNFMIQGSNENQNVSQSQKEPEKIIDPRSPEGVAIEIDKLLEWVLMKQATIRARNAADRPEQKEISPVRKIMVELIEWCEKKEIIARAYENNKKYGFDPYEYVDIINDLKKVRELRQKLNEDVDACLEFATNNDPENRFKPTKQIHRKYYKHIKLEEEKLALPANKDLIKKLEKLNKELKLTSKQTKVEINDVQEEIKKLLALLPDNERLEAQKEIDELNGAVSAINENVHDENDIIEESSSNDDNVENYDDEQVDDIVNENDEIKELLEDDEINKFVEEKAGRKNKVDDLANEKIILLDEELKKVNRIINKNKKVIKSKEDLPISKVRDEMDQLLIWISMKLFDAKDTLAKYGYNLIWKDKDNYSIQKIGEENENSSTTNDKTLIVKKVIVEKEIKKPETKNELMPKKENNKPKKVTKLEISKRSKMNSIEELYQQALLERKMKK